MFSCLEGTPEWLDDGEAVPDALVAVPVTLEPVDYRILTLLYRGKRVEQIAGLMGRSREEILARTERSRFKHLQREVEKGIVQQVTRAGEYEPVTVAKANATGAMKRIIAQSKNVADPRVFLAANTEVLRMAGCEPPKRIEITSPDRVLDQMTPQELEHFAATREWPLRFKDELQQFMRYEGGEVTVSQTKSLTVKSNGVVGSGPGGPGMGKKIGGAGHEAPPVVIEALKLEAPPPHPEPPQTINPDELEDE